MKPTKLLPTQIKSPKGASLSVSISVTGRTTIRPSAADSTIGSVIVNGFTLLQATKKSKSFWGKLWDALKSAVKAVASALTFSVGSADCRVNASVGMNGGKLTKLTLGISCTN